MLEKCQKCKNYYYGCNGYKYIKYVPTESLECYKSIKEVKQNGNIDSKDDQRRNSREIW